jgi:AraC-like DNA-binding protein
MENWGFTTKGAAPADWLGDWRNAMDRLHLPVGAIVDPDAFAGTVTCFVSPLGIEFARLDASAQEMSGSYSRQQAGIWLAVLIEGRATLDNGDAGIAIAPGDILFGPTGLAAKLTFHTPFRQLFIKVPNVALSPRLVAPLALPLGVLPGSLGINRVFSQMLLALSETLDSLTTEQLRPIELSLTEFLLTCLTSQQTTPLVGCSTNSRTTKLHSICQTIEANLSDPDLNPVVIAQEQNVSLRYLQKLFSQSGSTFSNYVRLRRLERCRADLASPVYAQMSVTEICFRWGFNGSAHFSRTFRSQYGVPPRDYRRASAALH